MKEEIKNHWKTWVFVLSLGIIFIAVYKALDNVGNIVNGLKSIMSTLTPFLVGLLMAYLIFIPERKIERLYKRSSNRFFRKKSRKLAILTTYIAIILILVILINFILPVLVKSVNELLANLQNYYSNLIDAYNKLPDDSILKKEQIYTALKELQSFDFKQYVSIEKVTTYIKGAVGFATGIFDVFVAIVVSVYILSERNEILKFFKRLSKAMFKEKTYNYMSKCFYKANGIFLKFLSTQFLDALIIGILSTIALKILNVKYAGLLGGAIGLFNMIPYFGAIIAILISALITLVTGGLSKTVLMLTVIIILQQIDANIINPKILGDSLKISPLLVILSVTIGGAYFGVLGMFLAVPIIAVLKILVNDYIDFKQEI